MQATSDTTTFSLTAPQDSVFNIQTWLNSLDDTALAPLSEDSNTPEGVVVRMNDISVYLEASPSFDTANTVEASVLNATREEAYNLKSDLEGRLSEVLFITDQNHIDRKLNDISDRVVTIGLSLERSIDAAEAAFKILDRVYRRTHKCGHELPAMSGMYRGCCSRLDSALHHLHQARTTHQDVLSSLHDNHIRTQDLPQSLQFRDYPRSFKKDVKYDLRHINPEEPSLRNIEDARQSLKELSARTKYIYQRLQTFLEEHNQILSHELNTYD
jgi:hypothetical protein